MVIFPLKFPLKPKKFTNMGRSWATEKTKYFLRPVKQWEQLGNMHNLIEKTFLNKNHPTVSEHHSVPIVPLTTATAHPHGFSYGFAMFSQMNTLLFLSYLCIFPSIWGLPTPFQMTISSCYGHAFYFWATYSLKMWPLAPSSPHLLWLMVVGSPHTTLASVRLALSDITADSLEVSQSLPDTTFVFYQSSTNQVHLYIS